MSDGKKIFRAKIKLDEKLVAEIQKVAAIYSISVADLLERGLQRGLEYYLTGEIQSGVDIIEAEIDE